MLLPQSGASFLTGLSSGRLVARHGSKLVLIVGALSCSLGFGLFAVAHNSLWEIALIGILMGVGFGLAFSAMANLVVAAVPSSQTGAASGMNANIRTVGGAIGTALLAGVVTANLQPTGYPAESSYTTAFLLASGALLVAALAGLLIPAVRRDPVTHEEPEAPLRHPQAGVIPAATLVGDGRE